jgi:uncharacterized protein
MWSTGEIMDSNYTAFDGTRQIATGPLDAVALAVKAAIDGGTAGPVLTFDDATGRVVDLDLRGSDAEIADRVTQAPRGRGRPRLGVTAREVTLLPRHWDWLAAQSGGASVTLRRLVDEARKTAGGQSRARTVRETAYRFMSAMAGDLAGFEEASRALFAGDRARWERHSTAWPADLRAYLMTLAAGGWEGEMGMTHYLEPTQETGRAFVSRAMLTGSFVMLNLLRFRAVADYSAHPELAPATPISGAEAYDRYMAHTLPHLAEGGGELLFFGEGGSFLVGPTDERWDRAMLVRQSSVQSFLAFTTNAAYLAGLGHRTAALEDSRLLPLSPV